MRMELFYQITCRFNVCLEPSERVSHQAGSHGCCPEWIWWNCWCMYISILILPNQILRHCYLNAKSPIIGNLIHENHCVYIFFSLYLIDCWSASCLLTCFSLMQLHFNFFSSITHYMWCFVGRHVSPLLNSTNITETLETSDLTEVYYMISDLIM